MCPACEKEEVKEIPIDWFVHCPTTFHSIPKEDVQYTQSSQTVLCNFENAIGYMHMTFRMVDHFSGWGLDLFLSLSHSFTKDEISCCVKRNFFSKLPIISDHC